MGRNRADLLALGGLAGACVITLADAILTPAIETTKPPKSTRPPLLTNLMLNKLDKVGFVEIPNAFSSIKIGAAREVAVKLYEEETITFSNQNAVDVRQDMTKFIADIENTPVALRAIITAMRSIAAELDEAEYSDFSLTHSHR